MQALQQDIADLEVARAREAERVAALQAEADAAGDLDWALHFLDGTTVRAHQHAAGASKKGAKTKPSAVHAAGSAASCT